MVLVIPDLWETVVGGIGQTEKIPIENVTIDLKSDNSLLAKLQ
jgi:hypothetical protein